MNLTQAQPSVQYLVQTICTEDEELNGFLLTLGCYSGQPITVISQSRGGYVISVKDGRYNIDKDLAEAIIISE